MTARSLALVTVLAALAACRVAGPLEPASMALLRQHGLEPTGPTRTQTIQIGAPQETPWDLYLEASRRTGLSFASYSGTQAQLETTPVAGDPPLRAHVLTVDGLAVGAWLSAEGMAPGIFALSDRP